MAARFLTVRERQVLASIRWSSRVAPWDHATLTELQRMGLAISRLMQRRDGRLAQTKTWEITNTGREAHDNPKKTVAAPQAVA